MNGAQHVTCRPLRTRALWFLVVLGAAGAGFAALRVALRGPDVYAGAGLLLAVGGLAALHRVTARVRADPDGLHIRTLLRRRSVPWRDIADLRLHLTHENSRAPEARRVGVALRDGHRWLLPLPRNRSLEERPAFDADVDALRALHRRYGAPESSNLPVVSYRTAGRAWAGSLVLCALLLAGAGVAAWFVPAVSAEERAWRSAVPCAVGTPAAERAECLTTLPAVIARTEANRPKRKSHLYFADSRPLERLDVPMEAALGFEPGDHVELTLWRGTVREVAGERYVWRAHLATAGSQAVIAAMCALAAGYPGARALLRLRGRRLPDDEVLPSALPYAGVLVGTALWLLPLCYLHPTTLFASPPSPVAIAWAAMGSLATLGLFAWAWRATRVRTPGETAETEAAGETGETEASFGEEGEAVFLAARFLEHADFNPYGFGTHIVLGGGPPSVTPHSGPGRFAAKRIPVERLALKDVRRPRGSDGDTVPTSWHIAELDDGGRPVRLAAAPADLARIIRALGPARR
jgi:hypothetical protein